MENTSAEDQGQDQTSSEEEMLSLSWSANEGTQSKRTIRLQGLMNNQEILILVDSGSSSTFISSATAQKLQFHQEDTVSVQVTVANGSQISSTKIVKDVTWWTQGHTFTTDARVLDLKFYDMVLGMDWLEKYSPMWIDWKRKRMRFNHKEKRITLAGVKDCTSKCTKLQVRKLQGLIKKGGVAHLVQLSLMQPNATPPTAIPPQLQELLQQHAHLFNDPTTLPPARAFDHQITLIPGAQPVNVKPYRYVPTQKDEIERQVKEMLANGVIQPSTSPYASPVLLVKKKDGSWRFCMDYRNLNSITVKNKYPLPIVDELLDELKGSQWFTKLDMRSGYHQVRMSPEDEHKTAFKTHHGHWEFKVMPFGLTNAPATFQQIMNTIFSPLLRKLVLVFVDDILVYSPTLEDHIQHLQQVFHILGEHQFLLKQSKCSFAKQSLEYLGHIISAGGVSTDPAKIQAVTSWPVPQDLKQLRVFLGLLGYYRKFIKHYGIISRPLIDLLKKDNIFSWNPQHQQAFDTLKQALASAPVLALPDFSKPFTIETDASATGIGAFLMQGGHPIAYLSKALGVKTQALSTYEKECLALIMAVTKWKPYLQHKEFTILTDQKSLIHLREQKIHQGMQQKAFIKLLGLQYKLVYKKGLENKAADALSRQSTSDQLLAISVSTPKWLEIIIEGYQQDPDAKQLLAELSVVGTNDKGYTLTDGVIRYKGKNMVG